MIPPFIPQSAVEHLLADETVEVVVEGIAEPIHLTTCQAVDEAIAAGQLLEALRADLHERLMRTGRPVRLVPAEAVITADDLEAMRDGIKERFARAWRGGGR